MKELSWELQEFSGFFKSISYLDFFITMKKFIVNFSSANPGNKIRWYKSIDSREWFVERYNFFSWE